MGLSLYETERLNTLREKLMADRYTKEEAKECAELSTKAVACIKNNVTINWRA